MPTSKKRRKVSQKRLFLGNPSKPPIPPDVDLRDTPIPIDRFIEMAMSEFGMDRETATKLVLETVAERHGAKGNA